MLEANVGLAAHCACLHVDSLNQPITYNHCGEDIDLDLVDIIRDDRPGPEDLLYCAELRAFMFKAFKKLPRVQKKVVFLHFKEDLSQSEIAKKLGLSRQTVNESFSAAMKKLRNEVTENGLMAPA